MTTKKKRPKTRTTVKWETEHGSQTVTNTRSKRGGRAKLKRPKTRMQR